VDVYLRSVGAHVPDNIYSNEDICRAIGFPLGKARKYASLLGVTERPICVDYRDGGRQIISGEELAYQAALDALQGAGMQASQVDAVISCSSFFDFIAPPVSSRLLKRLGLAQAFTLDLIGGCAEFLHGIQVASRLIRCGDARNVLVTSSETINAWWAQTRFPIEHFIFGDTGGAVVVSAEPGPYRLVDGELTTQSMIGEQPAELICMPIIGGKAPAELFYEADRPSSEVKQLSAVEDRYRLVHRIDQVAMAAPAAMVRATRTVLERTGIAPTDVYLVPHQASINVLNALGGTEVPPDQIGISLPRRGNMSTSSVPVTWAEHRAQAAEHRFLMMTSVGVGMSYGALAFERA